MAQGKKEEAEEAKKTGYRKRANCLEALEGREKEL